MKLNSPNSFVILDASCGMSIYASGCPEAIFRTLPQIAILDYVYEVEARWVENPYEEVKLNPLIERGLITVVSLTEVEEETAVNLSYYLDNGEAYSGAIAIHRNWTLAIDERKAVSHFKRTYPNIPLLRTPDIVKNWVEQDRPDENSIATAIKNIRGRAKFTAQSNHPLLSWWNHYEFL